MIELKILFSSIPELAEFAHHIASAKTPALAAGVVQLTDKPKVTAPSIAAETPDATPVEKPKKKAMTDNQKLTALAEKKALPPGAATDNPLPIKNPDYDDVKTIIRKGAQKSREKTLAAMAAAKEGMTKFDETVDKDLYQAIYDNVLEIFTDTEEKAAA